MQRPSHKTPVPIRNLYIILAHDELKSIELFFTIITFSRTFQKGKSKVMGLV